jgi:hypothetical protein
MAARATRAAIEQSDHSAAARGGSTPLLSQRSGDMIARLLVAAGAKVNDELPDGMSADAGNAGGRRRWPDS